MTALPRSRSRLAYCPEASGYRRRDLTRITTGEVTIGVPTPSDPFGNGSENCYDFLTISGTRQPNELELSKITGTPTEVSGTIEFDSSPYHYEHMFDGYSFVRTDMSNHVYFRVMPDYPSQTTHGRDAEILNNLALNQPVIDVPLFLFELREFPSMLRDLGRILRGGSRASDVPGSHLAYSFGWSPMVSDVMKLLRFTETIKQRIDFLTNLQPGSRIKRVLENSTGSVGSLVRPGAPNLYNLEFQTDFTRRVWYTARVRDIDNVARDELLTLYRFARSGHAESAHQVLRELTGLTASRRSVSTIWNAIPWSWLIDYCTNIGDIVESWGGTFPFRVKDICVMETVVVSTVPSRVLPDSYHQLKPNYSFNLGIDGGSFEHTMKFREPYPALIPKLRIMPFLNGRQRFLLGSLATALALRSANR